jgi:hypothetical protein
MEQSWILPLTSRAQAKLVKGRSEMFHGFVEIEVAHV